MLQKNTLVIFCIFVFLQLVDCIVSYYGLNYASTVAEVNPLLPSPIFVFPLKAVQLSLIYFFLTRPDVQKRPGVSHIVLIGLIIFYMYVCINNITLVL